MMSSKGLASARPIVFGLVWIAFISCARSPTTIYRAIFKDLPSSVTVLNAQDQYPLDCCIWLHFTIGKQDLSELLEGFEEPYIHRIGDYSRWNSVALPEMDWWKPEAFKEEGTYLERDSRKTLEGVYFNSDSTEVYYVNYLK